MPNEPTINARQVGSGWIDGNINGFRFQAKIYNGSSQFGINGGPVSKLAIWDHRSGGFASGVIVNYDRGWDEKPANKEENALFSALLNFLEALNPIAEKPKTGKGETVMSIKYNVTGAERKALAKAISEILEEPFVYMGTPSFAFAVGSYTIDRYGALSYPAETPTNKVVWLITRLKECGYEAVDEPVEMFVEESDETPDFHSLRLTEREELGLGRERCDPPGEDGMQADDVPEYLVGTDEYPDYDQHHPRQYANPNAPMTEAMLRQIEESMPPAPDDDDINKLVIDMPALSLDAMDSLKKIIASKETLIKKVLGADSLPVEVDGNNARFPWFTLTGADGEIDTYTRFVTALCTMAKTQRRVTAKEKDTGNEKFAMRIFLIRLGFVGPEYKTARKILLRNLTGNTAWKDGQRPVNSATEAGVEPYDK